MTHHDSETPAAVRAAPVLAVAPPPAIAAASISPDEAKMVEIANQLEVLVMAYLSLAYNHRLDELGIKCSNRPKMSEAEREAKDRKRDEMAERIGLRVASAKMESYYEQIDALRRVIRDDLEDWEPNAGLRAFTLLSIFDAAPLCARDMDFWNWPDNQGSTKGLVWVAAEIIGVLPKLQHWEERYKKLDADLWAAYPEQEDEPSKKETSEPTSEEKIEGWRHIIACCNKWIAAEAVIMAAAAV